ncbi:RNA polymerase ii subunit a c-terminal domain phosphatase [Plakobranchus ocellatus]|uniref:RNA polymerase II subunit A C-terminal domain phosphatase n=1 Tax=Plakobranchus ocellatus TaxID=259542 RepID=A0AAV3Z560_9GAST|nr:RNA polymerase ii subunit a c-terminal domain phosphatase [Plakobranchus ocellatus]
MAAAIAIQAPSKLKVLKWKVRRESHVFKGTVLALYCDIDGERGDTASETKKLKASRAGIVADISVKEGDVANQGDVLLRMCSQNDNQCSHPTIMKDMCAECGMDLRETLGLPGDRKTTGTATVAMVHSIPELIVSQEQAIEIGKEDENRLLKHRKLVLLVDLDQTLIHTTNDNIPPNLKGVKHFQLWHGKGYMWYHTRFRPFTQRFIEAVSKMYELHICTFGVRMYAHIIARLLDPDEKYFSHRILSRDECFDAMSKTANLKALFPCGDKTVCIIDDREDVWNFAPNLVHVKPYRFFQGTADINAPPGLTKREHDGEPITHKVVDSQSKTKDSNSETVSTNVDGLAKTADREKEISSSQAATEKDGGETEVPLEKEKKPLSAIASAEVGGEAGASGLAKELSEPGTAGGEVTVPGSQESPPDQGDQTSSSVEKEVGDSEKHGGSEDPGKVKELSGGHGEQTADTKKDGGDASPEEIDWDDPDDYLLHLEEILTRIHTVFYDMYEQSQSKSTADLPDLKSIIPYVRKKVLKGANIVFSGMVPLNSPLEKSRAYVVASALGASIQTEVVPAKTAKGEKDPNATTHLVAAKAGTGKHKSAMKVKGLHIVHGDWLWACSERWEWVEESLFPLKNEDSVSKNGGSSDEKDLSARNSKRKIRKREENTLEDNDSEEKESEAKRQKIETDDSELESQLDQTGNVNPIYSFSDDDLLTMDKEVNDFLEGEDESSDETDDERDNRFRKKVLGEESDSDSDSLSGDFPRGWKLRRKSFQSFESKETSGLKGDNSDAEDDEETENELERYQKNIDAFSPDESSGSASDDSIGSVDDEIADAVEKEFLSGL